MILPPLTLYIHIPWCVRKCPYCDFNSHAHSPQNLPQRDYVQALLRDLRADWRADEEREIEAIFIGGGTPSLFDPEHIAELLRGVAECAVVQGDAEITMEANPGALESEKLKEFCAVGVNRLSLGVQSFDDGALQRLGRIHTAHEARRALERVADAGFASWNLDLMYALPEQVQNQALDDLRCALQYRPPHLSWYQLTLEPNTEFYSRPPRLPSADSTADMERAGALLLQQSGYQRYEVSAWSRGVKERCRHNLNYWRFGDYLGIGAGAHGKLTVPGRGVVRTSKLRQPDSYLQAAEPRAAVRDVGADQLPLEFMLNVLRLSEGVPWQLYDERTGLAREGIENAVFHAQSLGLLEDDSEQLRATPLGLRYLNDLLEVFM